MALPGCNGCHDNHAEAVCTQRAMIVDKASVVCVGALQEEDRGGSLMGTHPFPPPIPASSLDNMKPCVRVLKTPDDMSKLHSLTLPSKWQPLAILEPKGGHQQTLESGL